MAASQVLTLARPTPTTTFDAYWIYQEGPPSLSKKKALGKWLVFQYKTKIDDTWEEVRQAVQSGQLGAIACKVSTMRPNPNSSNPNMLVICVYTTEEDMDEVGLKLVHIVKQKIRYKTDETTRAGKYACHGDVNVTCRTLDWNKGKLVFK